MKSMTGFGRATAPLDNDTLTITVNSVNRKTLDLTLALPRAWEELEPAFGEAIRKYAARGKVHVGVELTASTGAAAAATWDEAAAETTLRQLRVFAERAGVPFTPTAELVWQIVSAQRRGSDLPEAASVQETVLATLDEALRAFVAMREKEGAALLADFLARLEKLRGHVAAVGERAPQVAPAYRENLLRRLREAGLELDVSDERVLREVALFADRCDIAEELTRLGSHLQQFEALLKSRGEIGRKAEFILQEIGREVHTIGSKANDLEIARAVIEQKNELERIREQIANVE
ncbi:TIGR00255 family protein [Opitutaceae bacterium TAV1]|nr:TIGR00255 family protein [Opitutaceae bacterium TAV1]